MQIKMESFVSLALAALVNGLREGGEIGEPTLTAIESKFREAAARCDYRGEVPNSAAFNRLADAVKAGTPGYDIMP